MGGGGHIEDGTAIEFRRLQTEGKGGADGHVVEVFPFGGEHPIQTGEGLLWEQF